jgi:uncharacterized membrane protein
MTFSNPVALVLLLAIPYFLWLGWPRVAYRRQRDLASMVLRLLIVLMMILGLAGLQTVQAADKLSVVFLVDESDSMDQQARDQAQKYIRDALSHMGPEDKAGIVVFGKNALVERKVSSVKELAAINSVPIRLDTNLAEAIRLALALLPSDTAKRIVVLSDGVETLGNAAEAARLAAATNVQIDVVPLRRQTGPEVLVTDVRVPTTVNQGEVFDLAVTVESQSDTAADITILSSGSVIQTRRVDLKKGTNNFVLPLTAPKQGFSDFQVRVDPPNANDTFYQNNTLAAFSEVTGPPKVLVISSNATETAALVPALQQMGIEVDQAQPSDLPIGLAPLAAYKSVILADVSATELTEQRMKVLQSYVRDLGGGLVVIGGPHSYGVGGYYQTPLEETLPVDMRIKDQKRIPRLLMVYVIDRSGSMEEIGPSGVTNLELAKEATRRSLNFLFPEDRAGVLSFDSNPEWLVPIDFVRDRSAMARQVGSLRPGGGTDIRAAVAQILKEVPNDPSTLKHVILLTDGGADPTGIVDMVKNMHDNSGITVTSIGIGSNIPGFMRDIAVAGHGTFYNLLDLQTIPQVFAAETVLATRSYIVENEITPTLTGNSQIMQGISEAPSLLGYVATSAKSTATVILRAPGFDDPLLASWQYGLGRAVAWTSDATTRWSQNWTTWDQFGRFWSQVIRWTITEGANNKLDARVEQRNGQSVLIVEAHDDQGGFINSLDLNASIVDPKLGAQIIKLQQVAPGRYEAFFDPAQEGAYFIRIGGSGGNQAEGQNLAVAQTTGWVLSYSPEYRLRDTNMNLLDDLTRLTDGSVISEKPELAFAHNIREERAATSLWPFLLLAATILLPLDIAVRRVIITRSDVQKATVWLRNRIGVGQTLVPNQVTTERIARLRDAKDRAASATTTTEAATTNLAAALRGSRQDNKTGESGSQPMSPPKIYVEAPGESVRDSTPKPPPTPTTPPPATPEAGGTLASRLVNRRRTREDE